MADAEDLKSGQALRATTHPKAGQRKSLVFTGVWGLQHPHHGAAPRTLKQFQVTPELTPNFRRGDPEVAPGRITLPTPRRRTQCVSAHRKTQKFLLGAAKEAPGGYCEQLLRLPHD